jgi:cytoskeleton protein RodZ
VELVKKNRPETDTTYLASNLHGLSRVLSSPLWGRRSQQEHQVMDVGSQLRVAREARSLSIAALAARTRIPARALDGLERNDLSDVPPRIYARGFVASFAKEVGLNPDQTVREYFSQFEDVPDSPLAPPPVIKGAILDDENDWRTWLPYVGIAALVLTVGLTFARRTEVPRASERETVGTSGSIPPASAAPASVPKQEAAARRRDVTLPRPADPSVLLVLETDRPAWVAATVDGKRELYQILAAGTKTTLRGTRQITMRVGDAGAVRWSINSSDPVIMGAAGAIRDVTITPETASALR